jgi:hypothetical protein
MRYQSRFQTVVRTRARCPGLFKERFTFFSFWVSEQYSTFGHKTHSCSDFENSCEQSVMERSRCIYLLWACCAFWNMFCSKVICHQRDSVTSGTVILLKCVGLDSTYIYLMIAEKVQFVLWWFSVFVETSKSEVFPDSGQFILGTVFVFE